MADDTELQTPETHPTAPWLKGFLLGCAILGSGMIIGAALAYGLLSGQRQADAVPGDHSPARLVERIRGDLHLTDDQAKAVLDIFTLHHARMETIRMKVQPEVEAEMDAARKEVDAVLTPEQRPAWNKRCQEMRDRVRSRSGNAHSRNDGSPRH